MGALRRMRTSHLLALCAAVVLLGASATAVADTLTSAPPPPPQPLARAVHSALAAPPVEGVSARIELTNHLIEASSLTSGGGGAGGEGAAEPLLSGGSGRLWLGNEGDARLELQSEAGDLTVLLAGRTLSLYQAASDTLYRVQLPAEEAQAQPPAEEGPGGAQGEGVPSAARIEQAIEGLAGSLDISGALPTDVAGRPSYAVRLSPRSNGGLIGAVELAWDAAHGAPLKAAVYSTKSEGAPALALEATQISYGPVPASTFTLQTPAETKVTEVQLPAGQAPQGGQIEGGFKMFDADAPSQLAGMPRTGVRAVGVGERAGALVTYGHGLGGILVLESPSSGSGASPSAGSSGSGLGGRLPRVKIGSSTATILATALGTILSFERAGVSYVVIGSITAATAEAAARGL